MLHLFCYGSLKPGERNYPLIERWVRRARTAHVSGQLYLRETGYPTMAAGQPLTLGTSDHQADLMRAGPSPSEAVPGPPVPGLILSLSEGVRLLHLLDDFEDFCPVGPRASEYERWLVPARDEEGQFWRVWTYTAAAGQNLSAWPPIPAWGT